MSKYFGTDGFRGETNVVLTSEHAYKIGLALGWRAAMRIGGNQQTIVIGKDTRHSGDMFEMALAAGITATGCNVDLLGVVTTPGVAYITRNGSYPFGVMISASHNPYQDNGIKVLNANGEKLEEDVIAYLESVIDGEIEVEYALNAEIGRVKDASHLCEDYATFLTDLVNHTFEGFKVGLDCANGSASALAPLIYKHLGADVYAISTQPNGLNINVNCGSTHIEQLCTFVKDNNLDIGFAYDGDADRCLAVDSYGNLVDGDQIMYLCACAMKKAGTLDNNTVVTTIMSNFGLYKALDAAGIAYEKTAVGDKYVYENMAKNGHMIGGEQSGHIIFKKHATTGDGMLTSLMVMDVLITTGKTLAELVSPMTVYPQVLKNVRVISKPEALEDTDVQSAIDAAGKALGSDGRILVRQSGTEPVIRVMAEAPTAQQCEEQVDAIITVMESKGHVCK